MKTKTLLLVTILFFSLPFWKGGDGLFAQNNRLWASYYGSAGGDGATDIATDVFGNVYLVGFTESTSNISSGGFQNAYGGGISDALLVKFDSNGNRLWATYYGGTGEDWVQSVVTDAAGNVYMAGTTNSISGISSGGFQNTFGGTEDAFLVKFNSAGTRLWATYYGGAGQDRGYSTTIDLSGNVYLSGHTDSPSGIASGGFQNSYGGGFQDAFLIKFDAVSGNRVWATYYGGTGYEYFWSVASDVSGNVYLSGSTTSSSGISSGGFQNTFGGGTSDSFIVKFSTSGGRLWATYYGGAGGEGGLSVATDVAGNVYMAGSTDSPSGIASGGFQNIYGGGFVEAFLVKFSASGGRLWATYYGGAGLDYAYSVATDAFGNVYLAGDTESSNGIASGGFKNSLSPTIDCFVVTFDGAGNRLCATYYGSTTGFDVGGWIAPDASGNIYLAGSTSNASGIASGGFQNIFGGINDAFLVKFTSCGVIPLNTSISATNVLCNGQCNGTGTVNVANGTAPYTYTWNTIPVQTTQIATGLCAGSYTVIVTDAGGGTATGIVALTQPLSALSSSVTSNNVSCSGQCNGNATVVPSGGTPGYTYAWNTAPVQINVNATGLCPGNYSCAITDANGCTTTQTVTITEPSVIILNANSTNNTNCSIPNGSATITASGGSGSYTYSWSNGQTTQTATGLATATYAVIVIDANGCTQTQTVSISGPVSPSATASSTNVSCSGGSDGSATVIATGGVSPYNYLWSPAGGTNPVAAGLSSGNYIVTVTDDNGCTGTQVVAIDPPANAGELYLPNAFSPNGDGENDMLQIYYADLSCIKTLKLIIYNRWGEKVYETHDTTFKWDGSDNSGILRGNEGSAVFVYYMKVTLISGEEIIKKGNISLMR